MPLELQLASGADALRSLQIEARAYGRGIVSQVLFPGDGRDMMEDRAVEMSDAFENDPCYKWAKVVDTNLVAQGKGQDAMIAFAAWYVWEVPVPKGSIPKRPFGTGTNPEACERFFGGMAAKRDELLGGKSYAYLKFLHTDPTYQGRGAGGMLVKWGLDECRRLGIPAYLESSPAGLSLYDKYGFVTADKLVTDFSPWGGPSQHETPLMIFDPRA